jgi:hypothetical protein
MWRRTRDPRTRGPNELAIDADAGRLRAWRRWLGECGRRPGAAWEASPLAGAWQLLFDVRVPAPALQKVVVERRDSGGFWRELDGIFMVEFRSRSAQPRARVKYHLSVPVAWKGAAAGDPALRIAVRGFGQVGVGNVRLTDGTVHRRLGFGRAPAAVIGRRAPRSGFPDFDWQVNRGSRRLTFRR